MKMCVFCASSDSVPEVYFEAARDLGERIGRGGHELIYGGTDVGLMGALARATHAGGGRVTGVIPDKIYDRGLGYSSADELIVTSTMEERKRKMEDLADAFLALPGGFGTLDEVFQAIALRQLHYHAKPVVFLNINGYYEPLMEFLELGFREKFTREAARDFYHLAPDAESALRYIRDFVPKEAPPKWFERVG